MCLLLFWGGAFPSLSPLSSIYLLYGKWVLILKQIDLEISFRIWVLTLQMLVLECRLLIQQIARVRRGSAALTARWARLEWLPGSCCRLIATESWWRVCQKPRCLLFEVCVCVCVAFVAKAKLVVRNCTAGGEDEELQEPRITWLQSFVHKPVLSQGNQVCFLEGNWV